MLVALVAYQVPFARVGPSCGAFIAENSTEENRGKVYGLTSTIYQVTGILGPPLGGFLAGLYNFKTMLLVAATFYVSAAVLRVWMATTMRTPEEKAPARLSLTLFRTNMTTMLGLVAGGGVITWILVTDGISDISFRLSSELQPLYFKQVAGLSVQQIGLLGSIFAMAMMFVPLLSGKLVDRFGERVPIASGFLLIFAALIVFLRSNAFGGFALSWIIFGVGIGPLDPAYQSLISKVVPARMLGTFSGAFRGSLGFVSLPAPWLGAQLWQHFGPRLPFMLTAAAALLVVARVWFKFKAPRQPAAPVSLNADIPVAVEV
jgi:MFS family permease